MKLEYTKEDISNIRVPWFKLPPWKAQTGNLQLLDPKEVLLKNIRLTVLVVVREEGVLDDGKPDTFISGYNLKEIELDSIRFKLSGDGFPEFIFFVTNFPGRKIPDKEVSFKCLHGSKNYECICKMAGMAKPRDGCANHCHSCNAKKINTLLVWKQLKEKIYAKLRCYYSSIIQEAQNHLSEIEDNFLDTQYFEAQPTDEDSLKTCFQALLDAEDEPWWSCWEMVAGEIPAMLAAEDNLNETLTEAKVLIKETYEASILEGLKNHLEI